jgi:hypothetical protein
MVNFYPNLNPALGAVEGLTNGAALVLTDDTALRLYLYPRMPPDHVIGPFAFGYRTATGLDAYRRAVADRFFDAIVLDGGVGPQGNAIRQQIGPTIEQFYQRVYTTDDGQGFTIDVFTPLRPQGSGADDAAPWPTQHAVDGNIDGWGSHPETGDWQIGAQVAQSTDHTWEGHPTLMFAPTSAASSVSIREPEHVARIRARILITAADGSSDPVRVGFMGFDASWQWHDDGFRWQVPPGTWTTITWDVPQPDVYTEIGLKFPDNVAAAYVGSFEVQP